MNPNPIKQLFRRKVGPKETLATIGVVVVLAGLGYWACQYVAGRILEARVNAALPQIYSSIRQQRQAVIAGIEAYKGHFGFYPPDHILNRKPLAVDPVTNTLFYELGGIVYDRTNNLFVRDGLEAADAKFVKEFLDCGSFTNCAESATNVKQFLQPGGRVLRQFHDDPDVYALGVDIPYEGDHPEVFWEFTTTPWRYVSTSPTNNPGGFDLWLELKTKYRTVTIGNWKGVE